MLNNVEFNRIEFDAIKNESGRNSFVLTPTMWIKKTNSKGFKSKAGKYGGGTFAHKDIALEKVQNAYDALKIEYLKN